MAEGRFISRNIAFSEQLGQVSMEADYLFMRMLPHLDRDGRLNGSPTSIRARVCPLRSDLTDACVAAALAELDQAKLIVWYEVDGMGCVEYPQFVKHQVGLRKDRETPSKVPSSAALGATRIRTVQATPLAPPTSSVITPAIDGIEPSSSGHSKGSKGKLREGKVSEEKIPALPPAAPVADPKDSYVREGVSWWKEHVGITTYPRFGSALKLAVTEHSWEVVFPALQHYVKDQQIAGKPAKVEWFVADLVRWIRPRTAEVDEQGDPTPAQLDRWARL